MATAKLYEYLKRGGCSRDPLGSEQLDILGQLSDGDLRGLAKQAMLVLAERGRGPMENPITADEVISSALFQFGCLGRARSDEPVFVLRAQDVNAPAVVKNWISIAEDYGAPRRKIDGARAVWAAMRDWQDINGCKVAGMRTRPKSPASWSRTVAGGLDRGDFVNRYLAIEPADWHGPEPSIAEKAIGKWSAVAEEDESIAGIRQRAAAASTWSASDEDEEILRCARDAAERIRKGREAARVEFAREDKEILGRAGVQFDDESARIATAREVARADFARRVGGRLVSDTADTLTRGGVGVSADFETIIRGNLNRIVHEEFERLANDGGVRP